MKGGDFLFGLLVTILIGGWLLGVSIRIESCGSHGGGLKLLTWREYVRGWRKGVYAPPWRRL